MIKSKRADGFKRGAGGVYKCGCCGINTRRTNENSGTDSETCADCFELAGIYNSYQDHGDDDTIKYVRDSFGDEIIGRCENILRKGGKLDADNRLLYNIAKYGQEVSEVIPDAKVDTKQMNAALKSLAQEAATKHPPMEIITNTALVQSFAINMALSAAMRSFEDTTGKKATAEQTNALRQAFIKFYEG